MGAQRNQVHEAPPVVAAPPARLEADAISIEYVSARTGERIRAVDDISLSVHDQEFVSILGPSGCGKSSFLNVVAGLRPASGGTVTLDGEVIRGPGAGRAFVFQHAALLPWRSALDNVAYGLELAKVPKRIARQRAAEMIDLVGLSGSEHRYPYELSGGMRQRVNLARALVGDPSVLLLDEPFAALDAQTRELMQDELLRVWSRRQTLALFVTHQISEAIYLSDRVVVLSGAPSRVRAIIDIDLPRPRTREMRRTAKFNDYEDEIFGLIRADLTI